MEGTHAEIKPIEFSKHASGHPITIKTIALTQEEDLLVGISWGEGKMEFAQPSSDDEPSRRDRRSEGGGSERRPGDLLQRLPVIIALDEDKDGERVSEHAKGARDHARAAAPLLEPRGDPPLAVVAAVVVHERLLVVCVAAAFAAAGHALLVLCCELR